MSCKKIPKFDSLKKETRLSKPRNPESINLEQDPVLREKIVDGRFIPKIDETIIEPGINPQEFFEPSRIESLQRGSLSTVVPRITPPDVSEDPVIFEGDPQAFLSVDEDNRPIITPVEDPPTPVRITRDEFEENTRRRQPPPVSFNPLRSIDPNQIPQSPNVQNLPPEWQSLPPNFQAEIIRLLPLFFDVTDPSGFAVSLPSNINIADNFSSISGIVSRLTYVPPNLFAPGEPFPSTVDLLADKNFDLDFGLMEPPNRSNDAFLNSLKDICNKIKSINSEDIKGDDYEVVVFTRIEDDEQRDERSEPEWQATIREKEREEQTTEGPANVGGRIVGDFTEGDPFPVPGSEVTVQEIETDEIDLPGERKLEVAIKVILSNGEEIEKVDPDEAVAGVEQGDPGSAPGGGV